MQEIVRNPANSPDPHCTPEEYEARYKRSVEHADAFWLEEAHKRLDWYARPTKAGEWSFDPVEIKWFADGSLNLCHNCVDRHLPEHADRTALIFEPDDPASPNRTLNRQPQR